MQHNSLIKTQLLDKFLLNHSSVSQNELIDASFLNLNIPGANSLYKEIIDREEFILITHLTMDKIKSDFSGKNYKIEDYFKKIDSKQISATLNLHTFHLIRYKTQQEFAARRKILAELKRLRYELLIPDKITLDANTPVHLHFSNSERLDFINPVPSQIPLDYRALCIYDFIVDRLYRCLIKKGDVFKHNLISDFLMIHNDEVKQIESFSSSHDSSDDTKITSYENKDLKLIHKIIHCLQYTTFDKKSAGLLDAALNTTIEISDSDKQKELTNIPLTPDAYFDYESKENEADPYFGLTKRSHFYFSLMQYSYLLDLKCVAFANNIVAIAQLENERQQVKAHMKKWNNFKNQCTLVKCESLIAIVNRIPRQQEEYYVGMWDSSYWEEFTSTKGEKGVIIKALNTNVTTNLFTQSFALKIQDELKLISKGMLNTVRMNDFQKNDSRYKQGYSIFIKLDDLNKCPLDYLLARDDHMITAFKNTTITKIILTDQLFFKTKTPANWLHFLKQHGLDKNDLKSFIWNLAALSKMKNWLADQKDKNILPMELLCLIVQLHGKLLDQENSKTTNSKPYTRSLF